jgi:SnoaL-like domain
MGTHLPRVNAIRRSVRQPNIRPGEILAPIASDDDSGRLRAVYGIDWAAVEPRRRGLAAAAELMAPDVEARMSPEVADRVLHGVSDFAVFVEGLEEDFSEFRYDADDVAEIGSGRYVVTGVIRARGRRSKMPLSAAFRHEWTFRDGIAQRVEASVGGPTA